MDDRTRELAFKMGHGYCMCSPNCPKKAEEIHHKLRNSKLNKRLFPLFIHSIFNLCPVNHGCHMSGLVPRIKQAEAQIYEEWLRLFKEQ